LDDGIGDEIGDQSHDNLVRHHSIGDWAGRNHFLGDWQIVGSVGVGVGVDSVGVDVDANACSSAAMWVAVQIGSVDDSLDGAFAGCGGGDDYCRHRC
jgi:hypothetical protein